MTLVIFEILIDKLFFSLINSRKPCRKLVANDDNNRHFKPLNNKCIMCNASKSDVISREDIHALRILKSSSGDFNRIEYVLSHLWMLQPKEIQTESFIFFIFQRLQKALKKRRDAMFGSTLVSARISFRQGVHRFVHYTSALMPTSLPICQNF